LIGCIFSSAFASFQAEITPQLLFFVFLFSLLASFKLHNTMSQPNKGEPKKFKFGFPSKKAAAKPEQKPVATLEDLKRKAADPVEESVKKPRSSTAFFADDEDELLASAGIG
jgi:hypothetical protein